MKSAEPPESIQLIPEGAARLRIYAFTVIGDGAGAREWVAPPKPAYKGSASHCWQGDTVTAVADQVLPSHSNDQSIPRFTWWNHRGTSEWIQAEFPEPRDVARVTSS